MNTNPYASPATAKLAPTAATGASEKPKLHSAENVAVASFLGTPTAALALLAVNYHRRGRAAESFACGVAAVLAAAALLLLVFTVLIHVPTQLCTFFHLGVALAIKQWVKSVGAAPLREHLPTERRSSIWAVVGVSLVTAGAMFGLIWILSDYVLV